MFARASRDRASARAESRIGEDRRSARRIARLRRDRSRGRSRPAARAAIARTFFAWMELLISRRALAPRSSASGSNEDVTVLDASSFFAHSAAPGAEAAAAPTPIVAARAENCDTAWRSIAGEGGEATRGPEERACRRRARGDASREARARVPRRAARRSTPAHNRLGTTRSRQRCDEQTGAGGDARHVVPRRAFPEAPSRQTVCPYEIANTHVTWNDEAQLRLNEAFSTEANSSKIPHPTPSGAPGTTRRVST